jgi:hypothetical protein
MSPCRQAHQVLSRDYPIRQYLPIRRCFARALLSSPRAWATLDRSGLLLSIQQARLPRIGKKLSHRLEELVTSRRLTVSLRVVRECRRSIAACSSPPPPRPRLSPRRPSSSSAGAEQNRRTRSQHVTAVGRHISQGPGSFSLHEGRQRLERLNVSRRGRRKNAPPRPDDIILSSSHSPPLSLRLLLPPQPPSHPPSCFL